MDTERVNEHMHSMDLKKQHKKSINRTPNKRIKIKPLEKEIQMKNMNKSLDIQAQIGSNKEPDCFISRQTEIEEDYHNVVII